MSDTEILSPASENGDTAITKKRMSERDADSSDESSSYDDKVESSQNGMNEKAVHSNGKEVEGESEDEGSHGFRMDGEPDYKPRKARTASSSSESEEEADDVDEDNDEDDSSARSNRMKQMKSEDDSAISKSSESAVAPKNEGNESSSDTDDDADKDIDEEEEEFLEKADNAPVPMARKVSVPADTIGELSRDEWELSKRETVNVEDAARKISAVEINEDSESEPEEDNKKIRTYSSSDAEEEVPEKNVEEERKVSARSPSSSSSEEVDDGSPIIVDANNVQPRANGGAEIRRPQFRHSASSLSDEEIQVPSESSPKHKIEERKQQLAAAAQEVDRPPSSQSPLPTRANADKITKMYTEALGNNNNDNGSSSKATERAKPSKDITSIYTQAMVSKSTPPASPKPVPSKNRGDITQLYTGGLGSKSPAGNASSPCIVADKLSPKKHNMATAVDKEAIRQAYDDVRNDNSDIEWAVFKFEGNNLNVAATGKDFQDFKSAFTNDDRGFGYIRIGTGDEMSKRAKFVFVTWVGPSVSVMKKAKMSTDKALMKDIIQNLSVELQLENHAEFSHDFFKGQVDRASGARYGTGERAL